MLYRATVLRSACNSLGVGRPRAGKHLRPAQNIVKTSTATSNLSSTSRSAYPRKDSQDKDSINAEATEYSKSGSDDGAARQDDAAFNPDITNPQEQKDVAGKGTGDKNNPLEVSPANPEVSKSRGQTEGGAENSSTNSGTESSRERTSGGGSPSKGRKVS